MPLEGGFIEARNRENDDFTQFYAKKNLENYVALLPAILFHTMKAQNLPHTQRKKILKKRNSSKVMAQKRSPS